MGGRFPGLTQWCLGLRPSPSPLLLAWELPPKQQLSLAQDWLRTGELSWVGSWVGRGGQGLGVRTGKEAPQEVRLEEESS